jgi:hypothetical protein
MIPYIEGVDVPNTFASCQSKQAQHKELIARV